MQSNAMRRIGKTYGKTGKNAVVHDLYDYRFDQKNSPTVSSTTSSTPTSEPLYEIAKRNAGDHTTILSPKAASYLSSFDVSEKQTASELKKSLIQDTSVFDIVSSEDDGSSDTSGSRASKKRRVVPNLGSSKASAPQEPKPFLTKVKKVAVTQKEADGKQNNQWNAPPSSDKSKTSKTIKTSTPDQMVLPQRPTMHPQIAKPTLPPNSKPGQRSAHLPAQVSAPASSMSKDVRRTNRSGIDASETISDQSQHAVAHAKMTPKRKRLTPIDTDSDRSSPSQLGLHGLRLAATRLSPARVPSEPGSDVNSKHHSSRRRLIDRLDVPTNSEDVTSEDQLSDFPSTSSTKVKKPNRSRLMSVHKEPKTGTLQRSAVTAEGPSISSGRIAGSGRSRTTYATQRSYLSDMIDGLEEPIDQLSQKSTDEALLQVPGSNLGSQLEIEEDSDGSGGPGKLKSIHELRQAGANSRFDRELDALLEDVNAGQSSSKALRVQALMKLVVKLEEPNFVRQLVNSRRIQRLVSLTVQQMDLPTCLLLMRVFWSLAKSDETSIDTLGQLFQVVSELAPAMLAESRSLSEIAKDRKQNFSKATINDMIEFEKKYKSSTDDSNPDALNCPDTVTLNCLECLLRSMVQLGDTSTRVSASSYAAILRRLQLDVRQIQDDYYKTINHTKISVTLSLLELCAIVVDESVLRVGDDQYQGLGNTLARIIYRTSHLSQPLDRGVLRLVVSLSNNKPRMCQLLGDTDITKAAFGIIDDNFFKLAKQAEDGVSLDEPKLDSIVLALGCLLNFAECDSTLRVRLSQTRPDEINYIARLVSIFNSQASKVNEAMTKEQSQVSVAFGYLSMLLCTLSLHPAIKAQVTQLLKDRSFGGLCAAAEQFFGHLRTLEHISEDDASMGAFTARFSTILETVRASQ